MAHFGPQDQPNQSARLRPSASPQAGFNLVHPVANLQESAGFSLEGDHLVQVSFPGQVVLHIGFVALLVEPTVLAANRPLALSRLR